jgi:ABC-type Fe3+ transport system permease subunit
MGLLALVVGVTLVLAVLSVVIVLSLGLALAWLIAAHAVLPAADAVEGAPTADED